MANPKRNKRQNTIVKVVQQRPANPKRTKKRGGKRRSKRQARLGMSDAGMDFLRCAFAAPDFGVDPGKGIPDEFEGKTLMDKNAIVQSVNPPAGQDTYYVFAPTPGVAYWTVSLTAGVPFTSITQLTPVYWPGNFGAGNIFGPTTDVGTYAAIVQKFRYASICAGLYPTSPFTSTAGSVTVYKTDLALEMETITRTFATTPAVSFDVMVPAITGLEALQSVSRDNYSQGCQQGCYAVSTCTQPDFNFKPIQEGIIQVPANLTNTYMFGRMIGPILGLGDMETIIMKVSVPTGATSSFQIRAWSCIEYTPTAGSALDRFAKPSAAYDPVALQAYRYAAKNIPLAVPCAENAHFWQTVINILQGGARVGSYMPGMVGVVSSAADVLLSGIKGLMAQTREKR